MAKSTKTRIEEIRKEIDDRTLEKLESILVNLDERVSSAVDRAINQIIANALGMSHSWGRWEVDNCNGRKTEIANKIGQLAMARVKDSFDKWLSEVSPDGKMPTGWKKSVKEEYDDQLTRKLREVIRKHVDSVSTTEAEKLVSAAMLEGE